VKHTRNEMLSEIARPALSHLSKPSASTRGIASESEVECQRHPRLINQNLQTEHGNRYDETRKQ